MQGNYTWYRENCLPRIEKNPIYIDANCYTFTVFNQGYLPMYRIILAKRWFLKSNTFRTDIPYITNNKNS